MAESKNIRRLVAEARTSLDISARYGGARLRTTGAGFKRVDFSTADDPTRRWLEFFRDNSGPVAGFKKEMNAGLKQYLQQKEHKP